MLSSLYIHIPFCRARCSYCDFFTVVDREADFGRFTTTLRREIDHWSRRAADGASIDTIFFGGGTPSLLDPRLLTEVLGHFRTAFSIDPGAEISLEANPSSTAPERLEQWREAGINRISFGVQSFDDARLRLLGRLHGAAGARLALSQARSAGFDNLSLDLIYGLPSQTIDDWRRDVETALELETEHLSLYGLTVEEGTPLAAQISQGRLAAPDDDISAAMYELAEGLLGEAGFHHYEISNWARPGYECRHNLTYWRNGEFIGLGPGAHSRFRGKRFAVVPDLGAYLRYAAPDDGAHDLLPGFHEVLQELDPITDRRESAMMRLRLSEGLSLGAFSAEFGAAARRELEPIIDFAQREELGVVADQRLRLTSKGRLLSNEVFQRIVSP